MPSSLPISSCWVITEGLVGLRNQAIGLAQALGVPYETKEVKKVGRSPIFSGFFKKREDVPTFSAPWPEMVISCGRQGAAASQAIRRQAGPKNIFTVHIQDGDPKQFDVMVVPGHDKARGENVVVTLGAVHHVTKEKLNEAAKHFHPLMAFLPRPLISVLVGGKNKHQDFTASLAGDFAWKLASAAKNAGGGLAVTFSRRTSERHEAIIRQGLAGVPSYVWDNQGENPYFGLLGLADVIVATSDSVSMVSEACSSGKPVYVYELPGAGGRHREFVQSIVNSGQARFFAGIADIWKTPGLDETRKAAAFVCGRYQEKYNGRVNAYADANSRNTP